ncbi:MAG: FliH/SctL family protein, partial [Pseudomonadota bacterium]
VEAAAYLQAVRESARWAGHAAGWAAGFEEGKQAGLEASETAASQYVQALRSGIEQLAAPLEVIDEQVERAVAGVIQAITHQVVQREIRLDSDVVIAIARQALAALPLGADTVRVRAHPSDAERLRGALLGDEVPVVVIEDPNLSAGGCEVSTDISYIDASVETRTAQMIAEVFGDLSPRGSEQSDDR